MSFSGGHTKDTFPRKKNHYIPSTKGILQTHYNPKAKTLKNKIIYCLNLEKLFKVIKQQSITSIKSITM